MGAPAKQGRNMKRGLCTLAAAAALLAGPISAQEAPRPELARHVAVLETEGADPVAFVLARLRDHDLVVFDDALHTAVEPFELYARLVRSPEFRSGGKRIFLESIPLNQQPHLEAYLDAPEHDPSLLYPALQNDIGGKGFPYATYLELLAAVRQSNQGLPATDRIRVIAVGSPTWWPEIRTPSDLELFRASLDSYDHTMYRQIVRGMDGFATGLKGIYLTNTRHAYKAIRKREGELYWNTGTFLHERNAGRTYHIRLNSAVLVIRGAREVAPEERTTQGLEQIEYGWGRVANGLWDNAAHAFGRWPVAVPIFGNAFGEAPYVGNHMLNVLAGQTMADAYDAVIFLAPLESQRQTALADAIYTPGFMPELARRYRLLYTADQIAAKLKEAGVDDLGSLLVRETKAQPEAPLEPARAAGPMDAWQSLPDTFQITADGVLEPIAAALRADLAWARDRIGAILGRFPEPVAVRTFPHRASFDEALRAAWGIPETACWMVGAADDHDLYLLSPDAWQEEACEHDPGDEQHRRLLVTHEAVHAYHGQANPSEDIGSLESIGWFVEGLATYVSGQLETSHAGRAAEALEAGSGPDRLEDAWSGPYRYGVAGSMVAYIDARWGRTTLRAALAVTTQEALLTLLDTTEERFLADWRRWVRGG